MHTVPGAVTQQQISAAMLSSPYQSGRQMIPLVGNPLPHSPTAHIASPAAAML